jgi:hypothetical protein
MTRTKSDDRYKHLRSTFAAPSAGKRVRHLKGQHESDPVVEGPSKSKSRYGAQSGAGSVIAIRQGSQRAWFWTGRLVAAQRIESQSSCTKGRLYAAGVLFKLDA